MKLLTTTTSSSSSLWHTAMLLMGTASLLASYIRPVNAQISLLNGGFQTTTDVQDILSFADDVADMKEAATLDEKKDIYHNGKNAGVSLKSLSVEAGSTMANPLYYMFLQAFFDIGSGNEGEKEGHFDGHAIEQYANTIVNDLFALSAEGIETEAALVMVVWMKVVDELYKAVISCRGGSKNDALAALDKSVAYWIGNSQEPGSNERGHMLYNLAEIAGERFGQDTTETIVNTELMKIFNAFQDKFQGDACGKESEIQQMRADFKNAVRYMTIPLVQNMIHHIIQIDNEPGTDWVELYALAMIPRVAACDPQNYQDELHMDVLRTLSSQDTNSAIAALEKSYSCLQITCADIGDYLTGAHSECSDPSGGTTLAGYTTNRSGAISKSYIDRDVLQIDILLKFKKYGLALDWYLHGWNSVYSLAELARGEVHPKVSDGMGSLFGEYWGDDKAAHDWIVNVLKGLSEFQNASDEQKRDGTMGFIKYVVMVEAAVTALQFSISECQQGRQDSSLEAWDAGVMFFIGSMVGPAITADSNAGVLMHAAARELCDDFSTCVPGVGDGDLLEADSNLVVLAGMRDAIQALENNNCDYASGVLETSMIPAMSVPLFQGTVKYASYNAGLQALTTDGSLAIGDAFTRSILPELNVVSPASADTIKSNMKFQLTTKPVAGGFDAVAGALRDALPQLGTQCFDIGVFKDEPTDSDLCAPGTVPDDGGPSSPDTPTPVAAPEAAPTRPPIPAPAPVQPHEIAFGRYQFSDHDVAEGDASFALDVRAMFEAADTNAASKIYTEGQNAQTLALSEEKKVVSLQSLNTEAATYMSGDHMFNIFKYSLYSDSFFDDTEGADYLYADEIVQEALTHGKDVKLAAEAAVVLNVWMLAVHRLYKAVDKCRIQQDPSKYIDSAVALWIGKGQVEAKFDNGWMMYSVGQAGYKFFGHSQGEAPINTKLFDLFNEAKSKSANCASDSTAFISLRETVFEAINNLSKPLIQSLLFHLVESTKNMVELYAAAVIPQASGCDARTYSELQKVLFSSYDKSKINNEFKDNMARFLRCQRITCDDIKTTKQADGELIGLAEDLCVRLSDDGQPDPIVGYMPTNDVSEFARLDMDILQTEILMATKAYGAATDVYSYGANGRQGSTLLSLRSLVNDSARTSVPQFTLFSGYYGSSAYDDNIVMAALGRTGQYSSASRWQLAETVSMTLQTMVSYMSVLTRTQEAVTKCKSGDIAGAQLDWDVAVALFVGSIEGFTPGWMIGGYGRQLYALGNEFCIDFGTCEGSGEAASNEHVMFSFAEGKTALMESDGQCEQLERTRTWSILPGLAVPVIQGVLYYAEENPDLGAGSTDEDVAGGHIVATAIEPFVNAVNATAASIISRNFDFDLTKAPVSDGPEVIYEVFSHTLRGMGVDCKDIGQSTTDASLKVCDEEVAAPHQDTPTNLGNDLYVTTTYVQDRANIALDIKDMLEALNSGNTQLAKLVYSDGKNSEIFDENGKFSALRSLAQMSQDETLDMLDDQLFNIFLFANRSGGRRRMEVAGHKYADEYVMTTFDNTSDSAKTLPAEAAVALNLWMYVVHLFEKTLRNCEAKSLRNEDGVHSIDEAVAYWIGDGEATGDGNRGHLLYALAEEMGEKFKLNDSGQSRTNTNIIRLFNQAKNELSLANSCSETPTTLMSLSRIVNKIIAQMSIPLIQGLIHNLRVGDRDRVSLYAHAYVPMVAGCNPNSFTYLRDKLITSDYNVIEQEEIVEHIRGSLSCLGLKCDDIGIHDSEVTSGAPTCEDSDANSLAGYTPATDVREYARFDLDLLHLDIFMQMGAYKAAETVYAYGKHVTNADGSGGSLSLSHLATTSDRTVVPQFETFSKYYQADDYADKIVRGAFDTSDGAMSDERRRIMVVRSSQVLVMYFGVLQALYDSVSLCNQGGPDRYSDASEAWDRAAAMLIGSLEGSQADGSRHGYMFYDLAQEYCLEFGTCLEDLTGVEVNDAMVDLLYSGRGTLVAKSCGGLRKTANELSSLVLIPIIQGMLSAAMKISTPSNPSPQASMAEGYVFSRAILPLVDREARKAAETISENLSLSGAQVTTAVAEEVYTSMAKAYTNGLDVDCNDIGYPNGFDPCSGVGKIQTSRLNGTQIGLIAAVVAGLFVLFGCVFFMRRRKKEEEKLPENNPKFVASEGELNHSMDLLQKAFSGNGHPPAETDRLVNDASPPEDDDDYNETSPSLKGSNSDII